MWIDVSCIILNNLEEDQHHVLQNKNVFNLKLFFKGSDLMKHYHKQKNDSRYNFVIQRP
jgi:hypothetical protein